jgi:hypothetical protein
MLKGPMTYMEWEMKPRGRWRKRWKDSVKKLLKEI